jgi:hypothetical protein
MVAHRLLEPLAKCILTLLDLIDLIDLIDLLLQVVADPLDARECPLPASAACDPSSPSATNCSS